LVVNCGARFNVFKRTRGGQTPKRRLAAHSPFARDYGEIRTFANSNSTGKFRWKGYRGG
jgi:hypothetical protein